MKKIFTFSAIILCFMCSVFATNNDYNGLWAESHINFVLENNIMFLDSNNNFQPYANTTKSNIYSYIINSDIDTSLNPDFFAKYKGGDYSSITRQDLAQIILEIAKASGVPTGITPGVTEEIIDITSVSEDYLQAVLYCWSNGIMQGNDGYFNPNSSVNRAIFSATIERMLDESTRLDFYTNEVYLPVMMYHSVIDNYHSYNDFIVTTDTFRGDLDYIKENGFTTILVADLIDYVYNDVSLPEKPILITFDDGYEDNYFNAFKILQEYDMKAVICPVSKYYEQDIFTSLGHLTIAQTREMDKSLLIEIQNHTYDMHDQIARYGSSRNPDESTADYRLIFGNDIANTHRIYNENNIKIPTTFSYPYGAFCNDSEDYIKEQGYLASFTTVPARLNIISEPEDLYLITRLNRSMFQDRNEYFYELETLNIR